MPYSLFICICGSRDFSNYELLKRIVHAEIDLKNIKSPAFVSGTARGVDKLGEKFAHQHNYLCLQFPADWDKFGKKAGHIRNKTMAEHADYFIIFWYMLSPGTKNMIEHIKHLKKPYVLYNFHGDEIYRSCQSFSVFDWI